MTEIVELLSRRARDAGAGRSTELTEAQVAAARIESRDLPHGWSGRVAMFCGLSSRFIVGVKGRAYVDKPHVVISSCGAAGFHVFLCDPRKPLRQSRVDLGNHLSLAAAFVQVRAALSTVSFGDGSTGDAVVSFAVHAAKRRAG